MEEMDGEQLSLWLSSREAARHRQVIGGPVFRARGFAAWKLLSGGFVGAYARSGDGPNRVQWCRFWRRPYPVAQISRQVAAFYFGVEAQAVRDAYRIAPTWD